MSAAPHSSIEPMDVDIKKSILPEQYECMLNILGELSKANGLEAKWAEVQPEVFKHIAALKKCRTAGDIP